MRDPELELLSILLFCGLCWLIFRYYWLRVPDRGVRSRRVGRGHYCTAIIPCVALRP